MSEKLLEVKDLHVMYRTDDDNVYALNGVGIELDEDPRSTGQFSGNYIWEEKIMDAICQALWGKEFQNNSNR